MRRVLIAWCLAVSSIFAADQRTFELNSGLNQPIEHWQFSSAGNRTGATGFFSQDIGKLAFETDDSSWWRLIGVAPTWTKIPNPAVDFAWSSAQSVTLTNATTNVVDNVFTLDHESTGTPANNFGGGVLFNLQDSTLGNVNAAQISVLWSIVTHAARTAEMRFLVENNAGASLAQSMQLFGSGSLNVGGSTIADPGSGIINASGGYWQGGAASTSGKLLQSNGASFRPSTATWPTTVTAGNKVIADGTNYSSTAMSANQAAPANPTGTTSTTGLMMGMGLAGGDSTHGGIATAAATSGKVLIIISGTIFNATAIADGGKVQIRHGTGTAPTNGAALTGTADGGLVQFICSTTAEKGVFSCNAIVTGLTASTNYWIDVGLAAITGGTATITDVSISAHEL